MGLERRGNGIYFYRKVRRGSRVFSIYEGSGKLALCMDFLNRDRRCKEQAAKDAQRLTIAQERQLHNEIDGLIDNISDLIGSVTDAMFLINGYHVHSRQWRHKRNG